MSEIEGTLNKEKEEAEEEEKKKKNFIKKKYDLECGTIECHFCVNGGAFAKIIKCLRY